MDFNQPAQTDMTFQQDERGFASFIPGENIFVYAQVSTMKRFSQVKDEQYRIRQQPLCIDQYGPKRGDWQLPPSGKSG